MTQYVRCKIKMPINWNWADCEEYLKECGCEVETTAVFLHIKGFPIPNEFKLKKQGEEDKEE